MDQKKVIEKLLKIATNQQKIIMKLAQQQQGLPPDALPTGGATVGEGKEHQLGNEPPPTHLKPAPTQKNPEAVFYGAMSQGQQGLLASAPQVQGSNMLVKFKPGAATQANYDGLLKLLQSLTTAGKIQHAYALKTV